MSHSILPPSSAHIWGAPGGCRGWVQMQRREDLPPDTDNEASVEGTLAHAEAERILTSGCGEPLTDDLDTLQAVKIYVDHVAYTLPGEEVHCLDVEEKVSIDRIHEECYGTPDSNAYIESRKTLYVWDYKHGRKSVDAFENWQAIAYAAGLIDELGLDDQKLTICIVIVQPNAYDHEGPIKTWTISAVELRSYINALALGAREAMAENPQTRSGPHCRYCRARTVCSSAIQAGTGLYESVNDISPLSPSLSTLALLYSLTKRAKEHIDAMLEGYTAQIEHRLVTGEQVPGYSLVPKLSNRKWSKPNEYISSFLSLLGVEAMETKLKSPAKVEKLIDPKVIQGLTERTPSGHKITKDNLNKVRKIFS